MFDFNGGSNLRVSFHPLFEHGQAECAEVVYTILVVLYTIRSRLPSAMNGDHERRSGSN
jgi:hypothetical protein